MAAAIPVTLRASVVVPARDAASTLPALLDALGAQQRPAHEVIVVDDGSSDATAAVARRSAVVTEIATTTGVGPGAARNAGAARATGEVLAFTDADCVPDEAWLAAGLAAIDDADLLQGAVRPAPGAPIGPFDRTIRVTVAHGLYETANLLIRRELFERLGGFEPWLAPHGGKELGEDVWLGYRARRAGARIAFCPEAVVDHAVWPRSPTGYVAERLRLRFFPEMTARIPELRGAFLHHGLFLTPRTAAFDLAVAGLAVAAVARRPVAALACLPYARLAARRGPRAAAVDAVADAVGLAALLAGSVRSRTPVL